MAETADIDAKSKVSVGFVGFTTFLHEVKAEMIKCTWPTKTELQEQTIVVVVSCLILGAVIWLSDTVLMAVMRAIF